jgi:hypothetical protein
MAPSLHGKAFGIVETPAGRQKGLAPMEEHDGPLSE